MARRSAAAVAVPTLGGINRTLIFDLVEGGARRRLVSRQESPGKADSPFLASGVQFRVMRIAHAHGVPVPQPVFEYEEADATGSGYVSAFVDGETMPRKILSRRGIRRGARRSDRAGRPNFGIVTFDGSRRADFSRAGCG